jgi:hypothetical protein
VRNLRVKAGTSNSRYCNAKMYLDPSGKEEK